MLDHTDAMPTITDWIDAQTTPPTTFTRERTKALPLRFDGWEIAQAVRHLDRGDTPEPRIIVVRIYVTTTAKLVTEVALQHGDKIQGATVAAHDDPPAALQALHERGGLPPASAEAWLAACQVVPALEPFRYERV